MLLNKLIGPMLAAKLYGNYTGFEFWVMCIGFGIIFVWICICIYFIDHLVRKFTFHPESNPYEKESLGIPHGTLRGMITLTLLIVVVVMVSMSLMIRDFQHTYDSLVDAFQLMISFYFGGKILDRVNKADKEKAVLKAESDKALAHATVLHTTAAPTTATATGTTTTDSDFEKAGALG